MKSELPKRALSARSQKKWALLGTLILCILPLGPTLRWPFGYDQGTFAYGGAAILKGLKPYIDFWDIKPPNIFYTYAVALATFGNTITAIRILDCLNSLVSALLICALTLRLFRKSEWSAAAGILAALSFVTCYLIQGFFNTAQVETFSVPFLLLSVLLLTSEKKGWIEESISGACIAIAVFYKFTNGLFLLVPIFWIWFNTEGITRRVKSTVFVLGGFALITLVQLLLMLPSGELAALWNITTTSTLGYNRTNFSGSFGVLQNIRVAIGVFNLPMLIPGGVGCVIIMAQSKREALESRKSIMLLVIASILAMIVVQVQNKGYTYHYQALVPWAVILIGAGAAKVLYPMTSRFQNWSFDLVAILGIVILCEALFGTRQLMESFQSPPPEYPTASKRYIAGDALVHYVLANTSTSDRIFIFGFHPYVYWASNRTPATRFLNTIHFKPSYVDPAMRRELVDSLTAHPPKLMLVETNDHYTSQGDSNEDSHTMIETRYPEIQHLLETRYALRDTIDKEVLAYHLIQPQS